MLCRAFIPKGLLSYIDRIATDIDYFLAKPYAGEIRAQDINGHIWHSRNLDYGFADILKNMTLAFDFQSRGQTVYSIVTYVGFICAMTGQRPNVFTVDERDQGSIQWNLVLGILGRKVSPLSFLVRDALTNVTTFEAAIDRLSYTHTAAGAYFINGGVNPGEGAVITKGRLAPDDIWRLDAGNRRWFLVETNYDHWTTPPTSHNRRY